MTISNVLAAVAVRLSVSTTWTKSCHARGSNGYSCNAESEDAVCWCLVGAVAAETKDAHLQDGVFLMLAGGIRDAPHARPANVITKWNDDARTRHIDVLELINWTQKVASDPAYR